MVPSKGCRASISTAKAMFIGAMAEVIAWREASKAMNMSDLTIVDSIWKDMADALRKDDYTTAKQLHLSALSQLEGASPKWWWEKVSEYVNATQEIIGVNGIPGWNNTTCSVEWRKLACAYRTSMGAWENGNMESLKYHLYQVDTIDSLSEEMTGTQTTCPKDIANDPFYDEVVSGEASGPPWWIWAGLVAGATVLLWPIVRK